METPPRFEYCVDDKGKFYVPDVVTSYLAREAQAARSTVWDPERGAWKRELFSWHFSQQKTTPEALEKSATELPLIVPGLQVVRTGIEKNRVRGESGFIWFTWSRRGAGRGRVLGPLRG